MSLEVGSECVGASLGPMRAHRNGQTAGSSWQLGVDRHIRETPPVSKCKMQTLNTGPPVGSDANGQLCMDSMQMGWSMHGLTLQQKGPDEREAGNRTPPVHGLTVGFDTSGRAVDMMHVQ